jgi:hypothetical protein
MRWLIRLQRWIRFEFREPFEVCCYVSRAKSTGIGLQYRATGASQARAIEKAWLLRHPYGWVIVRKREEK